MIILVTGSRDWGDYATILEALARYEGQPDVVVRHGACSYKRNDEELSADMLADRAADALGFLKDPMPADWNRYNKAAGYIRNAEMVKAEPKPNICHAFGKLCTLRGGRCTLVPGPHVSHGTRHCSLLAKEAGIELIKHRG